MRVRVLGHPAVVDDAGAEQRAPGAVPASVLAHLALARGRVLAVDDLAGRVWDVPPDNSRNALQAAVSRLRRAVGDRVVESVPSGYRLGPLDVDAVLAEDLLHSARAAAVDRSFDRAVADCTAGLELFDPELLTGLPSTASSIARSSLEDIRRELVVLCGDSWVLQGRPDDAVRLVAPRAAASPLDEALAACIVRALARAGRTADALEAYDRLRSALASELGVDPGPDAQAAQLAVLRGSPVDDLVLRRIGALARSRVVSIPAERRRAIGREREMERIAALLRSERLVTLVGLGGMGKTTLAAAIGRSAHSSWDGDVVMRTISGTTDADDVLALAVGGWGARPAHGDAVAALRSIVGDRRSLLVLDSCEGTAAPEAVGRLLDGIPALSILCTSRLPLRVDGEHVVHVGGLDDAAAAELLRLCADQRGVAGEGIDDGAASRIVSSVAGSPLGIELLAVQVAERGPDAVLRDLGRGAVDAPLDDVVAWARARLSADADALLRHLALLPAGLDPQLAGAALGSDDAAQALDELVASGLARRAAQGGPRWQSPEMVRVAVRSALAPDQLEATRRSVLRCFAEEHERLAWGWCFLDDRGQSISQSRDDLDAVLAEVSHVPADDAHLRCLLLLLATERAGPPRPRRAYAAVPAQAADPILAAWYAANEVSLLVRRLDAHAGRAAGLRLADRAAELDDPALESWACGSAAHALLMLDQVDDALALLDRADDAAARGSRRQVPEAVVCLELAYEARRLRAGCLMQLGRPVPEVEAAYHEALALARASRRPLNVLCDMATFAAEQGSIDLAELYVREVVALCGPGEDYARAHADIALAVLALRRGDPGAADRHTRDAMLRFRPFADMAWLADCFMLAADAAALRNDWSRCALLLGARRRLVRGDDPDARARRAAAAAREALGAAFEEIAAEGASVPTDAALRLLEVSA